MAAVAATVEARVLSGECHATMLGRNQSSGTVRSLVVITPRLPHGGLPGRQGRQPQIPHLQMGFHDHNRDAAHLTTLFCRTPPQSDDQDRKLAGLIMQGPGAVRVP